VFGDAVEELDESVGAIVQRVRESSVVSIATRTLVIFTSDNGAPSTTRIAGMNTPFTGTKFQVNQVVFNSS
jgi:arylsulfatase A-like enzyme